MKRNRIILIPVLLIIVNSYIIQKNTSQANPDPLFSLVAIANPYSVGMDYLNLFKQQVARIGIIIDIAHYEWTVFCEEFLIFRDYDLLFYEFDDMPYDPYYSDVYSENGSLNMFGYHTSMDWEDELQTGRNEWYIQNGSQLYTPNSTASINLNWEWQQYLMDKILPGVPLFTKDNDSFSMLAFNLRENRPVLGNRDPCSLRPEISIGLVVRKAIAYAINREEINEIVHGNSSTIINTPIYFQDESWCNPDIIEYCYHLDAARYFMTIASPSIGFPPDFGDLNTDDPCDTDYTDSISGFTEIIAVSAIVFSTIQIRKFVKKIRK